MTALCCIDTESRRLRRYIPTVHAGQRGVYCTDEFKMKRQLTDTTQAEINAVIKGPDRPVNVPGPRAPRAA